VAVPKKKTSKSRSKSRRAANMKITPVVLTKCPKCGEPKKAHVVCTFCGYYKGKKILNVESKLDKKLKKQNKAEENKE
jgi:large subunit ribosomal protein L32